MRMASQNDKPHNTIRDSLFTHQSSPPKIAPLYEKKKTKQVNHLHSTSGKIGSTLDFLEASQEMLHQIVDLVELGRITHHATGYVVLVLLQREKEKKKSNFPNARWLSSPCACCHATRGRRISPPAAATSVRRVVPPPAAGSTLRSPAGACHRQPTPPHLL